MQMTKKKAIEMHREMWRELAKSGDAVKEDLGITLNCWLCEYDNQNCDRCLLEWPQLKGFSFGLCPCARSYFAAWDNCKGIKTRKSLARKIANLKESQWAK